MTRLDQGAPSAAFEPVDLSTLIRTVFAEHRMLGTCREFDLAIAPDVWVNGDAQRLAQIVTNLLGNARNATAAGGSIWISLHAAAGEARVEVSDSGAGIAVADRERIFERFVRLDPSRASARGGSGLGLSIARARARAHAGGLECVNPLSVDSALAPGGARFVLTLPWHSSAQPTGTDSGAATSCCSDPAVGEAPILGVLLRGRHWQDIEPGEEH